jgi:hypothetical protein
MRAAVECHVLDKVRESLLVVGFVERTCLHGQPQGDTLRRPLVPSHHEGDAIGQGSRLHGRIQRNHIVECDAARRCRWLGEQRRTGQQRDHRADEGVTGVGRHKPHVANYMGRAGLAPHGSGVCGSGNRGGQLDVRPDVRSMEARVRSVGESAPAGSPAEVRIEVIVVFDGRTGLFLLIGATG